MYSLTSIQFLVYSHFISLRTYRYFYISHGISQIFKFSEYLLKICKFQNFRKINISFPKKIKLLDKFHKNTPNT